MKVYIANFGRGSYLWPTCLENGTIAIMGEEAAHSYWKQRDKSGYIDFCMSKIKTSKNRLVTRGVASLWFKNLDIFMETEDDLWIHRHEDMLWWTISTGQRPTSSLENDNNRPFEKGARAYVYHKPCTGWSCKDKQGRTLSWSGLHPNARPFLSTLSTFQNRSEANAEYAIALIEGNDLSYWHKLPSWKEKEQKSSKSAVKSFTARERTVYRIAKTVMDTVAQADGRQVTTTTKIKELKFSEEELKQYVSELLEDQEGLCALTGIRMQLDGEVDDQQLLCSLDRIDSDGHYEPGNLQLVCRFINFWKRDQRDEEFRRLLDLVQSVAS